MSIEEIDSYLKHLDELETNDYWDEMLWITTLDKYKQLQTESSKQTINELSKQIAKLVEDKKYLENQINDYRNTNINLIDKNKYLEQVNKKFKKRLILLENVLVKDKFNFSKPQVLTFKIKILESRIDKAIEKLQLLIDIGFDYDGFNQVNSLKGLIDELLSYAIDSRDILKGDE